MSLLKPSYRKINPENRRKTQLARALANFATKVAYVPKAPTLLSTNTYDQLVSERKVKPGNMKVRI